MEEHRQNNVDVLQSPPLPWVDPFICFHGVRVGVLSAWLIQDDPLQKGSPTRIQNLTVLFNRTLEEIPIPFVAWTLSHRLKLPQVYLR